MGTVEAERVGFEPTKVLPLLAFQASALGHYATSPMRPGTGSIVASPGWIIQARFAVYSDWIAAAWAAGAADPEKS